MGRESTLGYLVGSLVHGLDRDDAAPKDVLEVAEAVLDGRFLEIIDEICYDRPASGLSEALAAEINTMARDRWRFAQFGAAGARHNAVLVCIGLLANLIAEPPERAMRDDQESLGDLPATRRWSCASVLDPSPAPEEQIQKYVDVLRNCPLWLCPGSVKTIQLTSVRSSWSR